MSFCRIVSVQDEWEEGGQSSKFGFSYGTLNEHVVKGEERFTVEWSHENDDVLYEILSFSSPRHWLSQIGYPVARYIQVCFIYIMIVNLFFYFLQISIIIINSR